MINEITIRKIKYKDYKALSIFFQSNDRPEITMHFHPFPLTRQTAHDITRINHKDRYYIAIRDKEILGLGMLRGWDEGYDIPSFGMFVDYRHHGMGWLTNNGIFSD